MRHPREWNGDHTPGATHLTGAELPDRLDDVPDNKPVAVTGGNGYRSSVAACLLTYHGRTNTFERHRRHDRLEGGSTAHRGMNAETLLLQRHRLSEPLSELPNTTTIIYYGG